MHCIFCPYLLKNVRNVTIPDLFDNFSSLHNDACTSVADNSCHFHAVPASSAANSKYSHWVASYTVLYKKMCMFFYFYNNFGKPQLLPHYLAKSE